MPRKLAAAIRRADAPPGTGKLRIRRVLRHVRGMLSEHFFRIVVAAFIFFVPPAALYIVAEIIRDDYEQSGGWGRVALFTALISLVTFLRLLGQVLFSGFLDLAVGDSYFRSEDRTFVEALRDMPWKPLLGADLILAFSTVIGLELFVIPGIAIYTLFGLVGPVIAQEELGVRSGLRRTYEISRPHWVLVLVLVVIPLGIEHALAETVREIVDEGGMVPSVLGEWFIAATMLTIVGVIDVSLATELMARTPSKFSHPKGTY